MSIQPVATNRTMRSIVLPLASLCVALMLALGGATFAIVHEYATTACINQSLADRNGPTTDFAHHLYLETKIHSPTPAQRRELQRSTAEAIRLWYFQLRDNPLGRC